MPNPAMEALRQQQILTDLLHDEPGFVLALAETVHRRLTPATTPADIGRAMRGNRYDARGNVQANPAAGELTASFTRRVEHAVPYWVAHEMAEIVVHAAEQRPDLPINSDNVPTSTGFVWFDRGAEVPFTDQDGTRGHLVLTGLLWSRAASDRGRPGVWVTYFSDPRRHHNDELWPTLKANPDVDPFTGLRGFAATMTCLIEFGEDIEHTWWQKVGATLFTLLGQPVAASTNTDVDRTTRRWLDRSDRPVVANTVSIITLRRQKPPPSENGPDLGPDDDTESRRVGVRFWVGDKTGGFFRTYHTTEGPVLRWIQPYLAGPEGAPLTWKRSKVYAWKR